MKPTLLRFLQLPLRIAGVACIYWAFRYSATHIVALAPGSVFHVPSMVFVGVGCLGFLLCAFEIDRLGRMLINIFLLNPTRLEAQNAHIQNELHKLSEEYYREGPRALAAHTQSRRFHKIWRFVLAQMEARLPLADVQLLVQREVTRSVEEISSQVHILQTLAALAPAVGMLGTVYGLVELLSDLKEISVIGSKMALALVCTLYGLILANFICTPLANRLQSSRENLRITFNQIFFWLHLVQTKKPSFYLEPDYTRKLETA
jgi:chemotaxis protein MotA